MTEWLSRNIGAAITTIVLAATVIASWAVAQYQILDLRGHQDAIESRQYANSEAIVEIRADVRWVRLTLEQQANKVKGQ